MSSLRSKGKSTIVWILMGVLLLGLGGFGVTNFTGGSTEIGAVGETKVDAQTYARAMQNQMATITRRTQQNVTFEQAREMGLNQMVQAQLFTEATLQEEARQIGVSVGDDTVAEMITTNPDFQGAGGFDRARYQTYLSYQRMSESQYEEDLRASLGSQIVQLGVTSGAAAPQSQAELTAAWMMERRDISWQELTVADLPAPVAPADDATLEAWHQANADRFTAPEIRRISYVWLTPEMLAETVDLDEAALRETYDSRADEFNQPARRHVGQLVFESTEAAQAARDRIDAGEANWEQIAAERGLELADTELGEVTEAQLGTVGAAVFAAADNGVVGPLDGDLGPTLLSVNAILDPVSVSFEDALPDLRAEAAADRARRLIANQAPDIEDLLAGGARLEQVAKETGMELGQIDWSNDAEPVPGEIGGYDAFRERAALVTDRDYPELFELADGGVFALRLDEVVPPTLIPFDDIRERVAADWAAAEAHRQLVALGEEMKLKAVSETMPQVTPPADITPLPGSAGASAPGAATERVSPAPAAPLAGLPDWQSEAGLLRDGWLEDAPPAVIAHAFRLEEGEMEVIEDGARVALIRVDRIDAADLANDGDLTARIGDRLDASLQGDLLEYYTRAVQAQNGITLNPSAIAAVESQM